MTSDVLLRRATGAAALDMVEVWLRSSAAALPMVRRAHSDDEVRSWFAHVVVPDHECWVAEEQGSLLGLLVLDGAELAQLHLDSPQRGRGLDDQLVDLAKRCRPDGLER